MRTISGFIVVAMLAIFLAGCGENNKGPDQQNTPPTSVEGIDKESHPADQIVVDKELAVLKKVNPVYPEQALKEGLEGEVWVKIWVDTGGKPKQVEILKSDSEVFNQVSIDAAKEFLFTPAYSKGKPVSVWITVPFKFKLADKQGSK